MRTLSTIMVLAVAASCGGASLGASFQRAPMPSDPMKSLVYIYRPKKFMAGKYPVAIGISQETQGYTLELNNGAYIPYVADAGKFHLLARHLTGNGELLLNLQPQKEYYVRVTVDSVTVKEMSPVDGAAQIRGTSYEPSTDRKQPVGR